MLRITFEPSTLSGEQRRYVADMILNYPQSDEEDEECDTHIPSFPVAEDSEDAPEPSAEEAFGTQEKAPKVVNFPATDGSSLDKSGLPWDARIHPGSRAKNADGTWRRKRGVDDSVFETVEKELRTLLAIPSPAPVIPPPPMETPIPSAPVYGYLDLLNHASSLIISGKLTQAQLEAAVQTTGVTSLVLLANRLDLVPVVLAEINRIAGA